MLYRIEVEQPGEFSKFKRHFFATSPDEAWWLWYTLKQIEKLATPGIVRVFDVVNDVECQPEKGEQGL